jgi:UDP-N-acetylmuramoyl-tripeptide--D-alanyl-D-alanine ligase
MIPKIIKRWLGENLPQAYVGLTSQEKKTAFLNRIKLSLLRYVAHPIKRRLAKYYLSFLRKNCGLKVIGITGSAGKTTTKEMIASILKLQGKTVYSKENIDPVYNIPTTILRCFPWTRFLVLEMGIEYPGEMDFYLWLVKPDVGVITNISPTHILYLKDIEGVFSEKIKLVNNLASGGMAILNGSDPLLSKASSKLNQRMMLFGLGGRVVAENVSLDLGLGTKFILNIEKHQMEINLPILGKQFVQNALAATACVWSMGISQAKIKQGLESFSRGGHRMKVSTGKSGVIVIDDSYNNNPAAAREALEILKRVGEGKKKVFVFADMLELGTEAQKYHQEFGELVGGSGLDLFIGIGPLTKKAVEKAAQKTGYKNALWVDSKSKVLPHLFPYLNPQSLIMIKGSRAMGLDSLVPQLL